MGTMAPFCVCIGDRSTVKLGVGSDRLLLYFDYIGVEVRLAEAPTSNLEEADGVEEAVLTVEFVLGAKGYVWGRAGSQLGERYEGVKELAVVRPGRHQSLRCPTFCPSRKETT